MADHKVCSDDNRVSCSFYGRRLTIICEHECNDVHAHVWLHAPLHPSLHRPDVPFPFIITVQIEVDIWNDFYDNTWYEKFFLNFK